MSSAPRRSSTISNDSDIDSYTSNSCTSSSAETTYPLYPRRYYDASPTWFAWNRLTSADIFQLREESSASGPNIYFHLNHPIQFVRVVAVVVEIESVAEGRFTLITLDDGSGHCIVAKLTGQKQRSDDRSEWRRNEEDQNVIHVTRSTTTTVENVEVHITLGLAAVFVGTHRVTVGSVLRVKGTISTFRHTRQLEIKMLATVKDTNEETASWLDTARWKKEVLGMPWVLSAQQRATMDKEITRKAREEDLRAREKKERMLKRAEWKRKSLETDERRRRRSEELYNDGALKDSDILPAPW